MSDLVGKLVTIAVVVAVALLVQRIVVRAAEKALERAHVPSASIFVNVLRALIWIFALLVTLKPVFGIEPTAFIAALGIVSVAISLGLQDTISNIIAGLGLLLGHVLEPGDRIEVSGLRGVVQDVSWRSTTLVDCAGNVEVIPNSVLNKTSLTKLSPSNFAMGKLNLLVRENADFSVVAKEVEEAACTTIGDKLDPSLGCKTHYVGMEAGGVSLVAYLYVRSDKSALEAADTLMKSLSGKAWLAGPTTKAADI